MKSVNVGICWTGVNLSAGEKTSLLSGRRKATLLPRQPKAVHRIPRPPPLRSFAAVTIRGLGHLGRPSQHGTMMRPAMAFVLLISLAGAFALWPEDRSHARAERLAVPLVMELVALSPTPTALAQRISNDPLIETVAIWDLDGQYQPELGPEATRYPVTPPRLRALETLLAARTSPVWAVAPFTETDAIVRCQRVPDVCIVFDVPALADALEFPPVRLTRPLKGPFALGPALFLGLLAIISALGLMWRQARRRRLR